MRKDSMNASGCAQYILAHDVKVVKHIGCDACCYVVCIVVLII